MNNRNVGYLLVPALAAALALAATGPPAYAQGDSTGAESTSYATSNWFDHFVAKGGPIAFILIGISVISIALMLEHAWSIRRTRIVGVDQHEHIGELLKTKDYVKAIEFTSGDSTELSYVVNAGLVEAEHGYGAMERAVEEALEDRAARLFRKTEYLNIIGTVSPMLGLFGTVYGMIELFAKIKAEGSIPEPGAIADSISIALVTTFWGLAVAIPSLVAFGIFRNRIDVLIADCALMSDRLLGVFKPTRVPVPALRNDRPSGTAQERAPAKAETT